MPILITSGVGSRGDRDCIQRQSATLGASQLPLGGTHDIVIPDIHETRVEARVVNNPALTEVVGWTALSDQVFSATRWSGVFRPWVPPGGYYSWDVRFVHIPTGQVIHTQSAVIATPEWGVGAVFLLCGQSNAVDLVHGNASSVADAGDSRASVHGPSNSWIGIEDLDAPAAGAAHNFILTNAAWAFGPKTLTQVGAFTNYVHAAGDKVYLFGGNIPILPIVAEIASKDSNDQITLVESIAATDRTGVMSQPRSHGMTKLLNALQTAAPGNIPVGLILAAIDSTSLLPQANYLGVGYWLGTAFEAAMLKLELATGRRTIEAVLWQQGEAEATASFLGSPLYTVTPMEYGNALRQLIRKFRDSCRGVEANPVGFVVGTVGRMTIINPFLGANGMHVATHDQVLEDALQVAQEDDLAVALPVGLPMAPAPDGLHFTVAGQEILGTRMGNAAIAGLGWAAKSKRGPRIVAAYLGDEVTATPPTQAQLRDRTKITVYVKHDLGTDLTLGTHPHVAFEVHDEIGPLYVSAVTKGPAVAAGGIQKLLLTLLRNTAQTLPAKDRPYVATARFVGRVGLLKYNSLGTLPHLAGPLNRLIADNSADVSLLQPTRGWRQPGSQYPADLRALSSQLRLRPAYTPAVLLCKINSVAGLAARSVILNAPSTAFPNGWLQSGGAFNQIRPGDRFIAEQPGGIYIGEGTVEAVASYVNAATAVTVTISHDMASQAPTAADYLSFHNVTRSALGILVSSRDASAYGA